MKIVLDTKTGIVKYGKKGFNELDESNKNVIENTLRKFIINNTKLSDYEEDCMWMSYRYCIGRHTIASHMHANDIWQNCRDRMDKERQLFTAFDINKEIERCLSINYNFPDFHFPITSLNKIYSTAVDIVCDFINNYGITCPEALCKYKEVWIELSDNKYGYEITTVTWDEYFKKHVCWRLNDYFKKNNIKVDDTWQYYLDNKEDDDICKEIAEQVNKEKPNPEHCYMHNFEDLFVWNDLVHCFDYEHHHKSLLKDGTECEWFWSWTHNSEKREDGYYYRSFGYHQIRVPVNEWNGNVTKYIPDNAIKEDLY